MPGLPPPWDRSEVHVPSKGAEAAGYSWPAPELRGPAAQGRSPEFTPPACCFFSRWKIFSPSWEDSKGTGWAAAALAPKWNCSFLRRQTYSCAVGCQWRGICCFPQAGICPQHLSCWDYISPPSGPHTGTVDLIVHPLQRWVYDPRLAIPMFHPHGGLMGSRMRCDPSQAKGM